MATLTDVRRRITEARALPAEERRAAAAVLRLDVEAVLTDEVRADTAIATWTHLARLIEPAASAQRSVADARQAALALLDGADPLGDVLAARVADDDAHSRAALARERLRDLAVAAVQAGVEASSVARAAGVSRPTLYDWVESGS